MSSSPPRLLLVGCGKIGTLGHLPALRCLKDEGLVEVVACDKDSAKARAAGAAFDVPWVTDWALAAAEVDAVAVCLPPGPNAEVAAAALRLGRHVLCEKPPGRGLDHARELSAAAAERPDHVTMIAFNRRFNPLYQAAMARSLRLGAPSSFYGWFSQPGLGNAPDDGMADWITSSSSHAVDLAVATMGVPRTVMISRRRAGAGPEDSWAVQLHGERGGALLQLHYAAGRRAERFAWAGPGYDVLLDLPKRGEWAQSGGAAKELERGDPAYHHANGFTNEYRAFLKAITGKGPRPPCDFAYAVTFMQLVETILNAEEGISHPIAPVAIAAPVRDAAQSAGPVAPSRRVPKGGRPIVLLHQPSAVHHRFFSADKLAAVEVRGDLRLRGADEDAAALEAANVIVTGRGAKLPADIADRAPNLNLLVVLGASVRGFGAESLLARGVSVRNTADAVAQSVAEYCLMGALAGLRRMPQADAAMHKGEWPRRGSPSTRTLDLRAAARKLPLPAPVRANLGRVDRKVTQLVRPSKTNAASGGALAASDLRGQVVGLIGWGHTARRFAELLTPFGCTVLVASDSANADELLAAGVTAAPLEAVLTAKVVSLHKGLTAETQGFLDATRLYQLRPGSVLINTARGELVDEEALVERLARGDIVAVLDVYRQEPLPPKHPLRGASNAILTPHHASTTAQEERRMGDEALDAVLDWLEGRPNGMIDAERLARMS